tara:strand:+ start:11197 stop:11958 length:762 start_codon:yes stop_codon:yes gene_type:complete
MLTKRIIPCLDVKSGQVVKGVNFINLTTEGDPIELAKKYSDQGADELIFLDISATVEGRNNVLELVRKVAKSVFIPFSVGGGIRSTEDISNVLDAGADKVSINSAALKDPLLITKGAEKFGSQCIILAMDVKRMDGSWIVHSHGGTISTGREAVSWAQEAEELGAGEILLTSMDADGTKAGVDIKITKKISETVGLPLIASGGIGNLNHFLDAIELGEADAVLAASVFHRNHYTINEVKKFLHQHQIPIRITA